MQVKGGWICRGELGWRRGPAGQGGREKEAICEVGTSPAAWDDGAMLLHTRTYTHTRDLYESVQLLDTRQLRTMTLFSARALLHSI